MQDWHATKMIKTKQPHNQKLQQSEFITMKAKYTKKYSATYLSALLNSPKIVKPNSTFQKTSSGRLPG